MVSKNQIKHITSLHQKKYRQQAQLFIAEGKKVIEELLNSNYELEQLLITENVFDDIKNLKKEWITIPEMKKISCLSTPSNCLAIFKIKPPKPITTTKLIVALDAVRDPGNLRQRSEQPLSRRMEAKDQRKDRRGEAGSGGCSSARAGQAGGRGCLRCGRENFQKRAVHTSDRCGREVGGTQLQRTGISRSCGKAKSGYP